MGADRRIGRRLVLGALLAVSALMLPVLPVAAQGSDGWPTGREVRDLLHAWGFGFEYVGGQWVGDRGGDPSTISIDGPGGGPARVRVAPGSTDDASPVLLVAEVIGVPDPIIQMVLEEIDPYLVVLDAPAVCLNARHAIPGGTIAVDRHGAGGALAVTFLPDGAPVPTGDLACSDEGRAALAVFPVGLPEFPVAPRVLTIPRWENLDPSVREELTPFVDRLAAEGGRWDDGFEIARSGETRALSGLRFPGVDPSGLVAAWAAFLGDTDAVRESLTLDGRDVSRVTMPDRTMWNWAQEGILWQVTSKQDAAIDDAFVERMMRAIRPRIAPSLSPAP